MISNHRRSVSIRTILLLTANAGFLIWILNARASAKDTRPLSAVSYNGETPQTATQVGNSAKTADFETYGIPCILQLNEDYICPAIIEKDYSQHSQGTLTVIQYDVKPVSDDIWEFGQKNVCDFTSYEMRAVTTQIDFTPEYTGGKNVSIMRRILDYYNMDAPNNGVWYKDHLDRDFLEYEVEWQGQMPVCITVLPFHGSFPSAACSFQIERGILRITVKRSSNV